MGSPKSPTPVDDSCSKMDNGPDLSFSKTSSVVTLEPYSHVLSRPENVRRSRFRNKNDETVEICPGSFESVSYARFLVLKMKSGQRMREFDMFSLNREINAVCDKEPKISFLNDGTL